jgi:hypothetical protein
MKWYDLELNKTYRIVDSVEEVFVGKLLFVMQGADVYDEPEFFMFELENGERFEVHHHEFKKINEVKVGA